MAKMNINPKIVVTDKTKKSLDKLGGKGDTYNDIVERLIENAKRNI